MLRIDSANPRIARASSTVGGRNSRPFSASQRLPLAGVIGANRIAPFRHFHIIERQVQPTRNLGLHPELLRPMNRNNRPHPRRLRTPGHRARYLSSLRVERSAKAENIVLIGPTGVGKTGLACGLLLKALQNGHRGIFIRAQDLFDEMYASLADRSTRKLLKYLARVEVLLIDEMGYLNLKPEQANIFFKLMEERYRRFPTIITTNLDYDDWYGFLGNKPLVEALLSRLRHQCHTVKIEGPSLRTPSPT